MADDTLRQRRGKKAGGASANSTPAASSANTQPTPKEQLRDAHAKLVMSRERTADLHTAWRNQLFRLSLIVVFVSIHQLQSSIGACIREIKDGGEGYVSGMEAVKLIFGDSFCELLGVVVASLLAYFLALSKTASLELDHWAYLLSSALVPVCVGVFFQSSKAGCISEDVNVEMPDEGAKDRHQFPVIVIYHTIATVSHWFMKSGMQKCEDHVKLVEQSIKDFEAMDKKMEQRRKLVKAKKAGAKRK
ncbi:hypothetical protein ACHAXT_004746 [Thalassiosira profunda]